MITYYDHYMNLSVTIYYTLFITIGLLSGYYLNSHPFYYASKLEIYSPFHLRYDFSYVFTRMASYFLNGATMSFAAEITQLFGYRWLYLPSMIPVGYLMGILLVVIPMSLLDIDSFQTLMLKSCGPFSVIFYGIIIIAQLFFLSSSFSAIQSFLSGLNIVPMEYTKYAISFITLTYTLFGGINTISMLDIVTSVFIVIFGLETDPSLAFKDNLGYLIAPILDEELWNISIRLNGYTWSSLITFAILTNALTVAISYSHLRENDTISSAPLNAPCFFIDTVLAIVCSISISPLHIDLARKFNSVQVSRFFLILTPTMLVMLIFIFFLSIGSATFSIYSHVKIIQRPKALSTLYLHQVDSVFMQLFIYSALVALFIGAHNSMLVQMCYLSCSVIPSLVQLPHRSRLGRQLAHQMVAVVATIVSAIMARPTAITCIFLNGINILYTLVLPQILASFAMKIANPVGAITSLLVSVLMQVACMRPLYCYYDYYSIVQKSRVLSYIDNHYRLPPAVTRYVPIRTAVVVLSLLVNLLVSQIAQHFNLTTKLKRKLARFIIEEYDIDCDIATDDVSTASIRIQWNIGKIDANHPTTDFNIDSLPEIDRYYKEVPEDLLMRAISYTTHSNSSIVNDKYIFKKFGESMLLMFKTPIQNRMYKRDVVCDEKRFCAHLTKLHSEWINYVYVIGMDYQVPSVPPVMLSSKLTKSSELSENTESFSNLIGPAGLLLNINSPKNQMVLKSLPNPPTTIADVPNSKENVMTRFSESTRKK